EQTPVIGAPAQQPDRVARGRWHPPIVRPQKRAGSAVAGRDPRIGQVVARASGGAAAWDWAPAGGTTHRTRSTPAEKKVVPRSEPVIRPSRGPLPTCRGVARMYRLP